MITQISFHHVDKIELSTVFASNGNCRTVRIMTHNHLGQEYETELTFYGNTAALDALPKADDFSDRDTVRATLVARTEDDEPKPVDAETIAAREESYRRDMIDAGRGHLLR